MDQVWNDDGVNGSIRKETCSRATLSTTKPTSKFVGANPDPRGESEKHA
jgi:hypothetical protein